MFVMLSRHEGFRLAFLEAIAFGTPVIGGAFGGAPDVIVEGATGCLVEYGDVEALADLMICPAQQRGGAPADGRGRKATLTENYSFERYQKRLAVLLRDTRPVAS